MLMLCVRCMQCDFAACPRPAVTLLVTRYHGSPSQIPRGVPVTPAAVQASSCDAAPWISYLFQDFTLSWHWVIKHSACLQWLVLLHGNESGWPDPDFWIRPDLDPAGSWKKNTKYPAGSGSRSGAPLLPIFWWISWQQTVERKKERWIFNSA